MKPFDWIRILCLAVFQAALLAAANPIISNGSQNLLQSSGSSEKRLPAVIYKNLARFHVGTILEKFDPDTRYYIPDPSAVAWLDEDDSTSFTLPAGKQWYLMTLEEPALIQNFALAAEKMEGKISIYASDQRTLPGTKNWEPLLKEVLAQDINEKEYTRPLYRYAKYFLIETNLEKSADISSFYLFTDSSASSYKLQKRPESQKSKRFSDKAGPFFKDSGNQINFASPYAMPAGGAEDPNLSAMTDESPQTTGALDQKPMRIDLRETRSLDKFSIFAEKKKGSITVSLEGDLSAPSKNSAYHLPDPIRLLSTVGWGRLAGLVVQSSGTNLGKPSNALARTMDFDGTQDRISIPLPTAESRFVTVSWASAETPSSPLKIKNISFMGYVSLNDYQVQRTSLGTPNNPISPQESPQTNESQNKETGEDPGQTAGQSGSSISLGNQTVKTEEQLNLPPVVPVSN
jgi:hypothetical protein